eukprot:jgi/Phyca11/531923/estExt2_fgenesh1_pg.C_PHYCAscaffold_30067
MIAATSALIVAFATLATSSVNAHGTLSKPGLKFTGEGYGGNFAALVPMTALTPQQGDIFTNYPDAGLNAAAFGRAFKASKYTSLKEFLLDNQDMSKGRFTMPKTPECGFTDPTANCAVTYPEGKFPYQKAKCEGKKRLTMYWMSTLMEWQVYIDCAKIGEGGPPASEATSTTATSSGGGSAATSGNEGTPATSSGGDSAATSGNGGMPTTAPSTETQTANGGTVGNEGESIKPRCKRKLRLDEE